MTQYFHLHTLKKKSRNKMEWKAECWERQLQFHYYHTQKKRVLSTAVSTWLLVIFSVWMCHCSFLPQRSIRMYLPGDSRLTAVTWLRCSPHPPRIFAVFLSFVIAYGGDGPLPYIQLVASNSSNSVYVKRDFSSKRCKGLQARNPNVIFGFMTVWFLIMK